MTQFNSYSGPLPRDASAILDVIGNGSMLLSDTISRSSRLSQVLNSDVFDAFIRSSTQQKNAGHEDGMVRRVERLRAFWDPSGARTIQTELESRFVHVPVQIHIAVAIPHFGYSPYFHLYAPLRLERAQKEPMNMREHDVVRHLKYPVLDAQMRTELCSGSFLTTFLDVCRLLESPPLPSVGLDRSHSRPHRMIPLLRAIEDTAKEYVRSPDKFGIELSSNGLPKVTTQAKTLNMEVYPKSILLTYLEGFNIVAPERGKQADCLSTPLLTSLSAAISAIGMTASSQGCSVTLRVSDDERSAVQGLYHHLKYIDRRRTHCTLNVVPEKCLGLKTKDALDVRQNGFFERYPRQYLASHPLPQTNQHTTKSLEKILPKRVYQEFFGDDAAKTLSSTQLAETLAGTWVNMLTQIPKLGLKGAVALAEAFPSGVTLTGHSEAFRIAYAKAEKEVDERMRENVKAVERGEAKKLTKAQKKISIHDALNTTLATAGRANAPMADAIRFLFAPRTSPYSPFQ